MCWPHQASHVGSTRLQEKEAKGWRKTTLPRPFLWFVQSEELMNSPVYLTQLDLGWGSCVRVYTQET